MSITDPDEMTAKASPEGGNGWFVGVLRTAALVAVVVGAAGSLRLMLAAANPPILLRILFAIWVLSPFAALLLSNVFSKRWPVIIRKTLHCVMLAVPLGSLAVYGYAVLTPHEAAPTATFLIVPLASLLITVIAVPAAVLISRRQLRHDNGA